MIPVTGVDHVVLFVADLARMASFYRTLLGLEVVETLGEDAVFLGAPLSISHHDLGLIRSDLPPRHESLGMYHFAFGVPTIQDLEEAEVTLREADILVGSSDHGTSLSLYGRDPEGNEFEIFWEVPPEEWGERGFGVRQLDLASEVARRA